MYKKSKLCVSVGTSARRSARGVDLDLADARQRTDGPPRKVDAEELRGHAFEREQIVALGAVAARVGSGAAVEVSRQRAVLADAALQAHGSCARCEFWKRIGRARCDYKAC